MTPAATATTATAPRRSQLAEIDRPAPPGPGGERELAFQAGALAPGAGRLISATDQQFEVMPAGRAGVFVNRHF